MSPPLALQLPLLPMNISHIHIDLVDKAQIVSLTHIDLGVTVLKQEIAAHVI